MNKIILIRYFLKELEEGKGNVNAASRNAMLRAPKSIRKPWI